ncbi:glyoxylate reductase/D-3-phosphoglycerate dehydrogenase [Aliiruegeria haliotis]|uniref:Glyoxylate reductase/D-3-phosphoglycerate dehydrogenase n=1 Tax=Aliiruegeria haliotis TaxID=1280846 RepID=A0A2T0RED9_9RHOB|nr:NAD(P)-dependent oxidoreductase [Aliiruegeria haliotis]PRY19522.1 glyoxylate reductase/D-3-phosphoglycerate dehydrogenase [Aliiruegeria haliotis]
MKILVISDSLRDLPKAMEALETSGHALSFVDDLVPFRTLAAEGNTALAEADAIVMGRVMETDAEALALARNARVIALHTSGTDNIDLNAAAERGIAVTNVRGVNAEQCAEFSIGLMIAITRQIRKGDQEIRAGRWAAAVGGSMDLYGATFGMVGLGQIGRAAARRAHAFGMKILCHTRTPDPGIGAELGIEYLPLDDVMARADVVSLYASLNPSTRGMIGAEQIARMKPSAFFVNIARGELVDEAALTQALAENRIAGAALDVFETEPLAESPLFALENTVLTPHLAGLTHGAMSDAAVTAVRNALAVLDGKPPLNPMNTPLPNTIGAPQ